jgi:hypothetical protein
MFMRKTITAGAAMAVLASVALMAAAMAQTPQAPPTSPSQSPPPASAGGVPSAVPPIPAPAETKPAETKPAEIKPAGAAPGTDTGPLMQFSWLEGCWRGEVNQREFREHWLPPRGALMIGASHTVNAGKTQGYEYLRLEPRADGIYYVNLAMSPGIQETSYKLIDRSMDKEDEIFTFANPALEFPQKISYRHNSGGWLYATVDGKVGGVDRQVIYPMRRIDCQTGEGIRK